MTFRKGDRVRLTKDAKRRLRDTPFWHENGRHPSQCDGIGKVVGVTPPDRDQLRRRRSAGHVTVRFPTTKRSVSVNALPRLLEKVR